MIIPWKNSLTFLNLRVKRRLIQVLGRLEFCESDRKVNRCCRILENYYAKRNI